MSHEENGTNTEKYFQLQRKDIVLLNFILEGYEGAASVTTLDPHAGYVKIFTTEGFSTSVDEIINAVQREFSFRDFKKLPGNPF